MATGLMPEYDLVAACQEYVYVNAKVQILHTAPLFNLVKIHQLSLSPFKPGNRIKKIFSAII